MTDRTRTTTGSRLACSGALATALAVAACVPEVQGIDPADDQLGTVTLALTIVPADARCLRVTVDSGDRITRRLFPLVPGQASTVTITGLPPGANEIREDVFAVECEDLSADVGPTWTGDGTPVVVVMPRQTTTRMVVLRPTGNVRTTIDFEDSAVTITPPSMRFNGVTLGSTSSNVAFTLRNTGRMATGSILTVLAGRDAPDFVIVNNTCGVLGAGQTCAVLVAFRPTSAGPKIAALEVMASPGGRAVAVLEGAGLTPPALLVTPVEYDFGTLSAGTMTPRVPLIVRNIGQTPAVNPSSGMMATSPGSLPFNFTSECRGITLQPGAECRVLISATVAPAAPGTVHTATFTITPENGPPGAAFLRLTVR